MAFSYSGGSGNGGDSPTCSFCGKKQEEVRKLIAGPMVYICDECVELCGDMIEGEVRSVVSSQRPKVPKPKEIKRRGSSMNTSSARSEPRGLCPSRSTITTSE